MTYIEQTCARDQRAHLVTDEVLAAALASEAGRLDALCGHVVEVASLATPPNGRCVGCLAVSQSPRRTRGALRRVADRLKRVAG